MNWLELTAAGVAMLVAIPVVAGAARLVVDGWRALNRREFDRGNQAWGLWRWQRLTQNGSPYLTKLWIVRAPWFSIALHWIHAADTDRHVHDHPWPFVSFPLRGRYLELRCRPRCTSDGLRRGMLSVRVIRWLNVVRHGDAHKILHVKPGTVTLVFTGPKVSTWGFYVQEPARPFNGDGAGVKFVPWREYLGIPEGAES